MSAIWLNIVSWEDDKQAFLGHKCRCGYPADIFFSDHSPPCCFVCFCLEIMEW